MENDNNMNELEQMREQMNIFKSRLDKQQIINEQLVRNSMGSKLSWIKNFVLGEIILVPILRAGMGLVNGIMDLIPTAKVGFIGLYRDEKTLEPVEYFAKFPKELSEGIVLVLDPMLATGGSAIAAVDMIKKRGAKNIRMVCLVGAPEGVKAFTEAHPDVDLYLAALDDHLNEIGYIVPGLGDAGDRIYGTK